MWDLRQHLLAGGIESPARERLAAPDLTESFRDHPGDREVPPEATVAEARRLFASGETLRLSMILEARGSLRGDISERHD